MSPGNKCLKVLYTNTDQFLNKRDDLCLFIAGDEPDVILLTEVIPKAQHIPINPVLLSIPGFTMYSNFNPDQSDLGASGSRGICIYVRSDLQVMQEEFSTCSFKEQLWVKLQLVNSDVLLIGCIYRSPSGNNLKSLEDLHALLTCVCSSNPSHLLIVGDFNVPDIDWNTKFSEAPENHYSHCLLKTINDCFLVQHVTEPTRYRQGEACNILDLVLTNEEGMLHKLNISPGLGNSDHVILTFELSCYSALQEPVIPQLDFGRANFKELNKMVQDVNWEAMQEVEIEESYQFLKGSLSTAVDACVPRGKPRSKKKNLYINGKANQIKKR